jgi:hypothetical protein
MGRCQAKRRSQLGSRNKKPEAKRSRAHSGSSADYAGEADRIKGVRYEETDIRNYDLPDVFGMRFFSHIVYVYDSEGRKGSVRA